MCYIKAMKKVFILWLAAVAVVTILSGTLYVALQQTLRMGANDPQVQLAEDTAATWRRDGNLNSSLTIEKVNPATSLAPFVIAYDASGNVLASGAELDNRPPELPTGVLGHAKGAKQNRLTWQPQSGVRLAAVVVAVDGHGYVLAARNLSEVEERINRLELLIATGWALAVLIITATSLVYNHNKGRT